MKVWYTSDQHFGHANIITHCARPFASVVEMNDALVYNWNAVVAPEDTVWVLGDVALSMAQLWHVGRLHGTKILVAGNHDSCWLGHKRWRREVAKYEAAGFARVFPDAVVVRTTGAVDVKLSHLPYAGDSHPEDRYADKRPVDDMEMPMFCGHVHEAWKTRRSPEGSLMINVGVDQWDYTPVAESVLLEMLKAEGA